MGSPLHSNRLICSLLSYFFNFICSPPPLSPLILLSFKVSFHLVWYIFTSSSCIASLFLLLWPSVLSQPSPCPIAMSSVISCPISSPFISSPLIVFSLLLSSFSSHLISTSPYVLSSHLFRPSYLLLFFHSFSHVLPIISSRLISTHPRFYLPPTSLVHFVICKVVFVSGFACGSSLPVARCAVVHEPRDGRTKISLPRPCAGNDNNPRKSVDTQTHTHRGDTLECYCKGVVSYPQYKVIWSYTPEGNTLINSSTCSQTWPCLSPTHTYTQTHTHSGQSSKGLAAYIFLLKS